MTDTNANPCPIGETSCEDCTFGEERSCTWGRKKGEEVPVPEESSGLKMVRHIVNRWLDDDGLRVGYGEKKMISKTKDLFATEKIRKWDSEEMTRIKALEGTVEALRQRIERIDGEEGRGEQS